MDDGFKKCPPEERHAHLPHTRLHSKRILYALYSLSSADSVEHVHRLDVGRRLLPGRIVNVGLAGEMQSGHEATAVKDDA